jgi:hypothetical protein
VVLLACSIALSQSVNRDLVQKAFTEKAHTEASDQKDQFIAAFEWSVEKQTDYVWPFESIKPAPFKSVRMLVEQMPRAWPERGGARGSTSLSAYRSLRVNGNRLPRPQRNESREEFRVYLEKGRLRISFSVPTGFKLDTRSAIVRIRLYQAE